MPLGRHTANANLLAILFIGLILLGGAGVAYFIDQQKETQITAHLQLNEMRGRMFEYQISRTFGLAETTLRNLADNMDDGLSPANITPQLSRALHFSPHLRSLNVLDLGGTIVASSSPDNVGKHPNPTGLLPAIEPAPGNLRIGLPWTGRDFGDGQPLLLGTPAEDSASNFIAASIKSAQGKYTLAAALNSDYFSNQIQLVLNPGEGIAELLRYDGRLLLSTDLDDQEKLGQLHAEVIIDKMREQTEFGAIEVDDYEGQAVLSAYRNSALFPLTIIVHVSRQFALNTWRHEARKTLALIVPLLLLLAGSGFWLHRELRRRDNEQVATHQKEQQRLTSVFDSLPASIMMLDKQGCISLTNSGWNDTIGMSIGQGKEWLGMHYRELLRLLKQNGWQTEPGLSQDIAKLLTGHLPRLSHEILAKQGAQSRYFHLRGEHLHNKEWPGALFMQIDISQQKNDTEQLRLASRIFESTAEGLLITDANQRIIWVNPSFTRITGYAKEDVIGRDPSLLNSGLQEANYYSEMYASLARSGAWQGEIINRRKDGTVYPEWLAISTLVDTEHKTTHYVAIFSDITERKASEERIRYLSEHDFLTQLPNRMLFEDRLRQTIKHAQRQPLQFAILFIDLDRFKYINDSFGHPVGDRLLQTVAERLGQSARASDTICRQGGDEFLLLLHNINGADDAGRIAEKIIAHLGQPYLIDGHVLSSSPSIGIALYPDDGSDAETLIRNADTAMYVSKENGRNITHFFRPDMNERTLARLSLEDGLRRALKNNELALYYQPQVAVGSGEIVGIEALLRWNDPSFGMRQPDSFIPIAEESGLIVAIGEWVLHAACRQARRWRDAGLTRLPISINIAALQFANLSFFASVHEALDNAGLSPDAIELEITESMLLDTSEERITAINQLKESGLKISIDDFGTGYSSLSYLHRLPVDQLKIDRSFISQINAQSQDSDNAKITAAIIQLAHNLGLNVLAEGVETEEQLKFLNDLGCDGYQGFLFSKPVSADDLERIFVVQQQDHQTHQKENLEQVV